MKLPMKGHFLAIGVLVLMSVAASAALNEGFETGYGEGVTLSGQNGWIGTAWGENAVTKADAGRLPSGLWGVLINDTNSGARIAHGLSTTLGDTIVISADVYITDQAARLGLSGLGGSGAASYPYLSIEINTGATEMWVGFEALHDSGLNGRINNVVWPELTANEWYRVMMQYTLNGDAYMEISRYSNGQATTRIAQSTDIGQILTTNDMTSLTGLYLEGHSGDRFDNINAVPEPASMTLLGLGSLGLFMRKRVKKS